MLIKLESGTILQFDKNHVIECKRGDWNSTGEKIIVGSDKNSLNDFLQKGVQLIGPTKYFQYDSKTQNCQFFIQWNLKANDLWTPEANKFTMQDAESIYKNLGLLEKINKKITDVAAIGDTILNGDGKIKSKYNI
jgi:hypothetical protein